MAHPHSCLALAFVQSTQSPDQVIPDGVLGQVLLSLVLVPENDSDQETPEPDKACPPPSFEFVLQYRGTSFVRTRTPLGPYRRPTPRVLGGPRGAGVFTC